MNDEAGIVIEQHRVLVDTSHLHLGLCTSESLSGVTERLLRTIRSFSTTESDLKKKRSSYSQHSTTTVQIRAQS